MRLSLKNTEFGLAGTFHLASCSYCDENQGPNPVIVEEPRDVNHPDPA